MNSNEEQILIEKIIKVFEEVSNRSELHARRALNFLRWRLSLLRSVYQCFELLPSVLFIFYLGRLFDDYFDLKIGVLSMNELKESSIPKEVQSMLKREF